MVKKIAFLSACLLFVSHAFGAEYDKALSAALRHLGQPVRVCPNVVVSESLSKATLPQSVTTQKVVPRKFSKETVDALLKIAGIEPSETFRGADRGVFGTPSVKYYGSLARTHTLTVIPAQGWMRYECLGAITNNTGIAPSEDETIRRGLEMAKLLGLNKDTDLMKLPGANKLDYVFGKTERSSFNKPPRIVSQQVFFRRAIDGVRVVTGHHSGGLWVGYGIDGVLHEFELAARATERLSTIQLAPLTEQIQTFKDCKQVFAIKDSAFWDDVKKDKDAVLTLEDVELIYFEDAPEQFQKVIPPLLRWEGQMRWQDKSETIIFFTPIRAK